MDDVDRNVLLSAESEADFFALEKPVKAVLFSMRPTRARAVSDSDHGQPPTAAAACMRCCPPRLHAAAPRQSNRQTIIYEHEVHLAPFRRSRVGAFRRSLLALAGTSRSGAPSRSNEVLERRGAFRRSRTSLLRLSKDPLFV